MAELVSELMFVGKSRKEIAGYDDRFMAFVLGLKRDQHGKLVRRVDGLPPFVEVDSEGMNVVSRPEGFGTMFMQVQRRVGAGREEAKRRWSEYLQEHPTLAKRARGEWNDG